MMNFQRGHYDEMSAEIGAQIGGEMGVVSGVVEIVDGAFEVLMGFEARAGAVERWLLIVFENGRRCSSNFDFEQLWR